MGFTKGKEWTLAELCGLPESKHEALKVGSEYYYTGKGCKNGHLLSPYLTDRAECLHCKRGRQVEYQKRSETSREYKRRYTMIKYYEEKLESLLCKGT